MLTEAQLQAAIKRLATTLGYAVYHTRWSLGSDKGWPDLALCKPPRLILAELKSQKGAVTTAQAVWLDRLRGCPGVCVFLWRTSDWHNGNILAVLQGSEDGCMTHGRASEGG